jgi:NTP pyrophosphatase (non-canonical NTP hydrolase)
MSLAVFQYQHIFAAAERGDWDEVAAAQAAVTALFQAMQDDPAKFADLQRAKFLMGLGQPLTGTVVPKQFDRVLFALQNLPRQADRHRLARSLNLMEDGPFQHGLRELAGEEEGTGHQGPQAADRQAASANPQSAIRNPQSPPALFAGFKLPTAKTDESTTIAELRQIVRRFVEERDWRQYHSPKNLSMSLAIEAAELMEHFQWIDAAESRRAGEDAAKLAAIRDEVADVLCYALALANELDIDLATALRGKMVKNAAKYPAELSRGRYEPPIGSE